MLKATFQRPLHLTNFFLSDAIVARREIERLDNVVKAHQGALDAAQSQRQAAETKVDIVLPAQKASAEAARPKRRCHWTPVKELVFSGH